MSYKGVDKLFGVGRRGAIEDRRDIRISFSTNSEGVKKFVSFSFPKNALNQIGLNKGDRIDLFYNTEDQSYLVKPNREGMLKINKDYRVSFSYRSNMPFVEGNYSYSINTLNRSCIFERREDTTTIHREGHESY